MYIDEGRVDALLLRCLPAACGCLSYLNVVSLSHLSATTTMVCPCCKKKSPIGFFLFKTHSPFLNHTSAVNNNLDLRTRTGESIFDKTKGALAVCEKCCTEILRADNENNANGFNKLVGYLTFRQNKEYRTYAKLSSRLHQRGYVVTERKVSMPLGLLMHLIVKNKKNIARLIKGEGEKRTKHRQWCELTVVDKNAQVELQKNRDELSRELEKIINPDGYYAKIALQNRNKLLNLKDEVDEEEVSTVEYPVGGESVLFRSTREGGTQKMHKDNHDESYNIVEPLTSTYSNLIMRHTNLLPHWGETNKPTVFGTGEKVTLQASEMLVMHSNTIHCGGRSSRIKDNFDSCKKKMNKEYLKLLKKWGGEGKSSDPPSLFQMGNATDLTISDIALHREIHHVRGRPGSSEMNTGKTKVFPPIHIRTIPEISDTDYKIYREAIKNGRCLDDCNLSPEKLEYFDYKEKIAQCKCLYREASEKYWPHGKQVPIDKPYPCSGVINEAGISVERLVRGATTTTGDATARRSSMRLQTQASYGKKRKEPEHKGLSYCTCGKCCHKPYCTCGKCCQQKN